VIVKIKNDRDVQNSAWSVLFNSRKLNDLMEAIYEVEFDYTPSRIFVWSDEYSKKVIIRKKYFLFKKPQIIIKIELMK